MLPLRSNLPAISEFVFASIAPGFGEKASAAAGVAIRENIKRRAG